MRVLLGLVILMLARTIPATAQEGMPQRPATYPPGSLGEASRAHLLTLAEARSLIVAMKALEAVDKSGSAGLVADSSLTTVLAGIERAPAVKRAIAQAGLTPRQFAVGMSAFGESMETAFLQRMVGQERYPTRGRWENIALYDAHAAEFDRALGIGVPAPTRPAKRAGTPPEPRPGTLTAAAEAHVLTMTEIRRLSGVDHDVARAGVVTQAMATSRSVSGLLDHEIIQLTANDPFHRIVLVNGFTARGYLIARAALDATMMAIRNPELDPTEAELPRASAKNLALVRRHAAALDSLAGAVSASLAAEERATLQADAGYQRRMRVMDSLSRFIRTDSLARLFARAIDAPDAAIPALAQELACEMTRLTWRYGYPATVAQRRMRDSLWAGRPKVYQRTNERVFSYGMAAPITDEACRYTRWPKAVDSLQAAPRRTTTSSR